PSSRSAARHPRARSSCGVSRTRSTRWASSSPRDRPSVDAAARLPERGRAAAGAHLTLRPLRALPADVPDLPRARRRAGLAARPELVPNAAPSSAPLPARFAAVGAKRGTVALFTGCVMRAAFAGTNAATARVLARNGIEVLVPAAQTCCGALHAHAGERAGARELAMRNIATLEPLAVDAFIVNAAGCGANLKEYGWLLKDTAWAERGERFSARVKDAAEYLAEVGLATPPGPVRAAVAYDDPCHLIHGQKISAQPRELLAAIPELTVVPLVEADWCCGSAGTYNVTQPDPARRLGHRKAQHIMRSGAALVVTANPGCQMQIEAALRREGSRVTVVHLMDLLDRAYASR